MAYATETRTTGLTLGHRIGELRTNLADRWARYTTYRNTLNELSALTDRELADLGIARGSIQGIATFAAYGEN